MIGHASTRPLYLLLAGVLWSCSGQVGTADPDERRVDGGELRDGGPVDPDRTDGGGSDGGLIDGGNPADAGDSTDAGSSVTGYDFASFALQEAEIRANIQRFGALGLSVHLTELDLRVSNLPLTMTQKLAYQSDVYQRLVDVCRSEAACTSVTFWGFTDKYSWVDAFFGADDPLLYDDGLAPKPARTGVLNGLDGLAGPGLDLGLGTNCGTTLGTAAWCAPFEATDLGRDYTAVTSGSVTPSTTRFYKGARSLSATVTGGSNGQSVVGRRALAPRTSGELWMRTYVYVPTGTATQGLTLLAMGEADPPFHGVSAGISGGKVQLGFTTANQFPVSSVTFPTGAWTCVELRVTISNTAGAATVYLNGTAVQTATGVDTLPAGGISNANLGILYVAPGSPTIEAWFDEAAFGTQRLPCD